MDLIARIFERNLLVIAAIVSAMVLSTSANARTVEHGEIATWFVFERYHTKTEKFMRCTAESNYLSGVYLTFGINNNYEAEFAIHHRDWLLDEDSKYLVTLDVDGKQAALAVAGTLTEQEIAFIPENQKTYFDLITSGEILTVNANDQEFKFYLEGMETAMIAGFRCVDAALAYEKDRAAGSPFAQEEVKLDIGDLHDSLIYKTVFLTLDTKAFGVAHLEIMDEPPASVSTLGFDLAWDGNGIVGVGAELPAEGNFVSALIAGLAEDYEEKCDGDFLFETLDGKPVPGDAFTRTVLLQCDAGEDSLSAVYTYVPVAETLFKIAHFDDRISDRPKEADAALIDTMIDLLDEMLAEPKRRLPRGSIMQSTDE